MRVERVFASLCGLAGAVVERVELEHDVLVVHARPVAAERGRCGRCGWRTVGHDRGEGRRRWRALDLGTLRTYIEAEAPRVMCPEHGVVVARVPWARHGARHTRDFDDQAAWCATQCSKSAVCRLMRVSWRTVGAIIVRVVAERRQALCDPLAGLRRIAIDEVSYRRGQRYITAVLDHDTGRLVWAAEGKDATVLGAFFALLGTERCRLIALVSCDEARWARKAIAAHCPNAIVCMDPYHVVQMGTEALDAVRREVWNQTRERDAAAGKALKERPLGLVEGARAALSAPAEAAG